ncbi:MAG: glycosyl transferase family 1 [Caulobacteraceae bacterium]|nr:glycosyl transferase family 1 [Caulobacteraceae bacterium]
MATAWYPPHHTGGTEVYLAELAANLGDLDVSVLTPRMPGAMPSYRAEGVRVDTYVPLAVDEAQSRAEFEGLLAARGAAIYHQHSWTPDCGGWHLRAARKAGLKTVLTVHTPASLCLRGTMMRFGQAACDGRVEAGACGPCWAHSRGAPRWLAESLAHLPVPAIPGLPARARTALGAKDLVARRQDDLQAMIADADRVVAVCAWLRDALALNGTPADKLVLSRQGTSPAFVAAGAARRPRPGPPRRLLFLGRWDPVKGAEVVVRALLGAPELDLELTIHGIAAGPVEAAHRDKVAALAAGDRRIAIREAAPRDAIPDIMAEHDALVVPSTWMETGPLVVLEAMAAGLFVIGSDLGGVAELIDQPDKGVLVAPGEAVAWERALRAYARSGTPDLPRHRVRTMADAARDMADLYAGLG